MSSSGVFTISLDFELHWGVFDVLSIEDYRRNLLGARAAIPRLLRLFAEFEVHATWAVVGFLFCESRDELLAVAPSLRPHYRDPSLSAYRFIEEAGIGVDEASDPFHFAPSLIRLIAEQPHQEIGTHTFSHYYCLEPGQDAGTFAADLDAALVMAAKYQLTLRSIVLPG